MTPKGEVYTIAGTPENSGYHDGAQALFAAPVDLAYNSAADELYVADSGNDAVRSVDPTTGEVTTVAGTPALIGSRDGFGGEARFADLRALAYDPVRDLLYVGDGATIRVLIPGRWEVRTIAGEPNGRAPGSPIAGTLGRINGLAVAGDDLLATTDHAVLRITTPYLALTSTASAL